MGDADNALPPSKKRAAGRELSRDNPGLDDEEDTSEQETVTFKKASEEVLATRRIVKVRRQHSSTAPSSNPFAGICLVPPSATSGTTANAAAALDRKEDSNDNTCTQNRTLDDKDKEGNLSESKNDETVTEFGTGKEKNENANQATKHEVENDKGDCKNEYEDEGGRSSEAIKTENDKAENENAVENGGKNKNDNKEDRSEVNKPLIDDEKSDTNDKTQNDDTNDKTQNDDNNDKATEGAAPSEVIKPVIDDEKSDTNDKTQNVDNNDKATEVAALSAEGTPLHAFQSLSSTQNAFTGLAGTGFSSSTFSFGTIPKDGSSLSTTSGSLFGHNNGQSSPFSFSLPNSGSSSLFGSGTASILTKSEGSSFPSMKDLPVETGEENERIVFAADSVLFEFLDGTWKERGKGELKVNVSTTEMDKARILMRAKGNYRLVLNASLYPEMKLTNMEKKGITFACVNSVSDGKAGLSTFAAKFRDSSIVEDFRAAVMEYKDKVATTLKTPENSP